MQSVVKRKRERKPTGRPFPSSYVLLFLTFLPHLQAAAQKTVQAEEPEAAQLRLKLQSSKKDLQESQEDAARVRKELEETKHALEAARASSDAARVEQERLQAQLDAAAPESPAVGQAELAMALARVDDLADSPGVSDRDRHLRKNGHKRALDCLPLVQLRS